MHEREKSDPAIGAGKPTNKAEATSVADAAEPVEQRAGAKGNASGQSTHRTQGRERVSQALDRVRKAARLKRKGKLTALLHHINVDLLREAFFALKRDAAPGVDGMTWQSYEADLEGNLAGLFSRVQRGAYRALPSRRTYIPKADGRQRPLAVAALEDKVVQRATVEVLNCIYEEEFLGFSYAFRPGRGQHNALDALCVGIASKRVNFIFDADVRSFFDEVSQSWLVRFVEHRVGDPRIIRLIRKWLKAGVLEDGVVTVSDKGTGQGSVLTAARQCLPALRVRSLGRALATARGHGRYDHREVRRRRCGRFRARGGRPALLGRDAHAVGGVLAVVASGQDPPDRVWPLCGSQTSPARAWQAGNLQVPGLRVHLRADAQGKFQLKRKSRRDRMQAKLSEIKEELRRRMHQAIPEQGRWLAQVIRGYFAYHAVPTNFSALSAFRHYVRRLWLRTLRRRSQKDRFSWERMTRLADDFLPQPKILHPWPSVRFAVTTQGGSRMP